MEDHPKRGGIVFMRFIRFISKYFNMNNKIRISLSLFTLIPFFLISVYIYVTVCANIKKDFVNQVNEQLITSVNSINREYTLFIHKSRYFHINSYVISGIVGSLEWDPLSSYDFQSYMRSLTRDLDFSDPNTRAFTFYVANYASNSEFIGNIDELTNSKLVAQILEAPAEEEIWNAHMKADSINKKYVSFYRNITNAIGLPCILEVNIPYNDIQNYLSQMHLPESAAIIHTADSGEILNPSDLPNAANQPLNEKSNKMILIKSKPLLDGSLITIAIPKNILYVKNLYVLMSIIVVLVTLAVLVIFASNFTSNKITGRLGDFMIYLKRSNIRGDYLSLDADSKNIKNADEISVIKQKFINIINTMNETHSDLITAKNQNNELQIKLLHARLNPHLLYNSLSAIKWFAVRNNDQKTAEMIDSMSYYYRIALNEGEEIIRVSDELRLIKEYVQIMQYTNSHPYQLLFQVDEDIENMYIPVHLLQPAVENAILHGLRKKPDGKITIRGYQDGEDLVFEVIDNGSGMDAETIDKVLKIQYKKSRGGYGIKNLIQRIQLYYGDPYGINIISENNDGTTLTIKIKTFNQGMLEQYQTTK
jgi:two-component system sensor histidine kinase YesM